MRDVYVKKKNLIYVNINKIYLRREQRKSCFNNGNVIVSGVGTKHLLRTTSILLLSSLSLLSSQSAITSSPRNLLPRSIG